jgi:hypothetical protein
VFPVEVAPVTSTMAKSSGTASNTTTTGNSQPSTESVTNTPTAPTTGNSQPSIGSVTNTLTAPTGNSNIQNGNIGRAVKTNAINPAIGGLL